MQRLEEALNLWERTPERPPIHTFVSILKKCRRGKDLSRAECLHNYICNNGLEAHKSIGNYSVPMFVECGSVPHAIHVFNRLVNRTEYSWTSLISGFIQCGQPQLAIQLYQRMQTEGVHSSRYTLMALLKACARLKDAERGREVHIEISQRGFDSDSFVGCALVDMYAKFGSLPEAQEVFDRLQARDVVLWTTLITGYAEHGPQEEVLKSFEQMQLEGICPDCRTFLCVLKACGSMGDVEKGRKLHAEIAERGFQLNIFIGNALVDMYAKCGSLQEAREVFEKLPVRNIESWNALMEGYTAHGSSEEVLKCFNQMQVDGVPLNTVTFICGLKACSSIGAIDKGREMHMYIMRMRFDTDLFVGNTLIDMYAKCGSLSDACEVFQKLPVRNVVSWNVLISGYAEHGPAQEAVICFDQMQVEGVSPSPVTFVSVLKACGSVGFIEKGREIHMGIRKDGFEMDPFLGSTLIDMYAKCGSLSEAQEVFDKLKIRNVVSWTALIAGYAENGLCQEALKCFEQMQLDGVSPNAVTFVCSLKVCGNLGAIDKGRQIHATIAIEGFERDPFIGSALIDMYSKCGSLREAYDAFDRLAVQNIVSWSTMINGYGINHDGNMAIQCFEDMLELGVKPNAITFTCLLTACSRSSWINEGNMYFKMMTEEYGIVPTMDHYTCLVDLLGRSGHVHEAEKFLETMSCLPSLETWIALLSACKTHGEVEVGLRCFQQLVQISPENAIAYVLMANIYRSAGRMEDACRIEEIRKLAGAKKKPASAMIEVNKKLHEFVVGIKQNKEISAMLEFLNLQMKEEEHSPNLEQVLRPISEEEKEVALCEHAEKLALAFGLLNTAAGQILHITKNMRMCNNCHNASKTISRGEKDSFINQNQRREQNPLIHSTSQRKDSEGKRGWIHKRSRFIEKT